MTRQVVGRFDLDDISWRVQHGRCSVHRAPEAVTGTWPRWGFDPERPVSLADYWRAVRDGIDPDDRFREMCAFLERAGRSGGGREGP